MSTTTPLSVAINTSVPTACLGLASMLEAHGMTVEIINQIWSEIYQITYKTNLPMSRLAEVAAVLDSAQPETILGDSNQKYDVVIHIPVSQAVNADHRAVHVEIVTDTADLGGQLAKTFRTLGFQNINVQAGGIEENTLQSNENVPEAIQALILLKARELGSSIHNVSRNGTRHRHHGQKIRIAVSDSRLLQVPPPERYPVLIRSDDRNHGQELADILAGHGFRVEMAEPMSPQESLTRPLGLISGPMSGRLNRSTRGLISHSLDTVLRKNGVDLVRYPINITSVDDNNEIPNTEPCGYHAVIDYPIAACINGTARSRGGAFPDRFSVKINTDCTEHSMAAKLKTALIASGFSDTYIDECHNNEVIKTPLQITVGSASSHPDILELVRGALSQSVAPLLDAGFASKVLKSFNDSDNDIFINLPLINWEEGTLLEMVSAASGTDLKIICEESSDWDDVISNLESWEFDSFKVEKGDKKQRAELHFGGAPIPLLNRICNKIEAIAGIHLTRKKVWNESDDDVFIFLPARVVPGPKETRDPSYDTMEDDYSDEDNTDSSVNIAEGPFVRCEGRRIQIGGLSLHRQDGTRHPLAPDLARFGHFCLDQKTAQTLQHVAISVLMNEPCLLEGETSTSKTSTIEYLAALLGQPLVRINLNGQTDTGELLGRFVPNDTASGSKIPAASLALRPDLLDARSAEIVQRAVAENRDLSEREREKVAALEGIPMAAWRWQDGLVIQALRNGWWLLLDEVNLAEAQILERLNSLLEAHPSLVLTEHGNEVFGDKGTPIHPSFRIFGTMNPAEYAGRSVLSPAYKDRWRGFRQVPGPSEPEYLAMLMLMVFGIQPSITLDNTVYPGSSIVPSHPGLDTLSDITEELKALARFHASMESAAGEGSGQLGLRRKERPVFTRRSLLSVLDYIGRVACPEPGTSAGSLLKLAATRYYMDRVAGTDDRQVVSKLLEASGLGMGVQA